MDFFNLHEELLKLQDANYFFENEVSVKDLDTLELDGMLNDTTDKIGESSSSITNTELFDTMRSFVKNFNELKSATMNRVLDIILSGLQAEYETTSNDLDADEEETYSEHRMALELYGFLLVWLISNAENKADSKSGANGTMAMTGGKTKRQRQTKSKTPTVNSSDEWDWSAQKPVTLSLMVKILELKIKKIWSSTHERDTFVSLFTKSAYRILENVTNTKDSAIKKIIYQILSVCVKDHNHAFGAQTSIMQNLQYYEHLAEPMAEFLDVLAKQYDHTRLTEEILIEISNKEFGSQDTIGPKSFSKFLVKLSELVPKVVAKQIGLLVKLLDNESYTIRIGLIEVLGNLIIDLASQEEQATNYISQINGFFDALDERFLDANSFCRSKVLQVYLKLVELKAKFPKRRQKLTDLVIRSLEDKSCHVRKNTIKLLTRLIATHPYGVIHGGELSVREWEDRLEKIENELKAIQPPQEFTEVGAESSTSLLSENDNQSEDMDVDMPDLSNQQNTSADEIMRLQLTRRYYSDAVRFIHQVHTAVPTLCQLLGSTTKSEVLEAMEFFVTAYTYKMEFAIDGIKRMLHLIWIKDSNDEEKGIRKRLIESYYKLYIETDISLTNREAVNAVTKNLISFTYNATLAELTSLEQLMSTMMAEELISNDVIAKLWSVYSVSTKQIPKMQRRGAIIILGMLAKAKMEIVQEKTDLLLKIGLGPFGKADLLLAKYTCIALQRLGGNKARVKGSLSNDSIRLPMSHPIFHRLKQMIEFQTSSQEWFAVAEQAINTIYLLGEHPDILCGEIIKHKTASVFDLKIPKADDMDIDGDNFLPDQEQFMAHPLQLSQLIFIVGHVAIKHIVHLEFIEDEWKRRKAEAESKDTEKSTKNPGDDELEQVAGTTEDEFGEAVAHIREKELLFGENSLLAVFGQLISNICANNKTYNYHTLQICATLALAKLMCVSSEFCENNLQLLFTILERSSEPTIRSNIIIALGDMTVCFNNIIDENINYLYKRLADSDNLVKKNTLMVLTHLILNGMIKVKGQLGEMAKCLEDEDQRISDLARLFFTELASKDNAVYNNLPDIISNLSSGDNPVNEESFKKIMKFLFDFIEKDKHTENVVEKLCQRFKNLDDRRQWRNIAYCLSLLPYKNERIIKKLLEGMSHYQDKLHENDVHKAFSDIITKVRSIKPQKPEMKQLIDEYESKIEEFRQRSQE
ncbi:Condensin complex subunit 1 [Gigaspora margarita]|uniref:Condensin complex subunit 1 n=1 Tax=Gigaspora margarita TaxID=4874 RepID=A0A8H3XDP5_GIGMA|nr:Condensin complex subunit 1 [Gigaspora margarita]